METIGVNNYSVHLVLLAKTIFSSLFLAISVELLLHCFQTRYASNEYSWGRKVPSHSPSPFLSSLLHSWRTLVQILHSEWTLGQIRLLRVMQPRLEYLEELRFHSLFGQHVFFAYHDWYKFLYYLKFSWLQSLSIASYPLPPVEPLGRV